ncbi:MAG: glutamine-hydrolyzing carbamoyl-phosphate synthase small subunit [Gammaproteobacteria bacterium]|nr:glutamine-hydrolyzing carbamoyl-phosphate synthase small subunit [Gammaproteobacteria bacterium]
MDTSGTANNAILVLEDGSVFHGKSIGAAGSTVGEVVFNTAMTGYQEILTDPSYSKQLVTLTYPHIGNTGTNDGDEEAAGVQAAGLIIRDLPLLHSNWRAAGSLSEYLEAQGTVAIADIDTRRLTRLLRSKGAQNGCIMTADEKGEPDVDAALQLAKEFPGLKGMDLAKVVTTAKSYAWKEGTWDLMDDSHPERQGSGFHVVAYDFGVKRNILRILADLGCRITVVPAETSAEDALALKPDGVFLSNGPGDPEPCEYAIKATKKFLGDRLPVFGICLGHQILGLAAGAKTEKMKFGHHGANHPVLDIETGRVMITSQNHGFAVDANSLPDNVAVTHRSLFDQSLQGIALTDRPAFGFQGHPEASPGPHDIKPLFERFIRDMAAARGKTTS